MFAIIDLETTGLSPAAERITELAVYLHDGRKITGEFQTLLNPEKFFRINRKYMITLKSITDVISYSNSRLKLKIKHQLEDDFLVAREKVKSFKQWLEGEEL